MTLVYTSEIHMTENERVALNNYVRYLADGLCLRDWQIELILAPADEGIAGRVITPYGRKIAHILLGPSWRICGLHELRDTLVHELLHCHLDQVGNAPRMIAEHLAPAAYAIFEQAFEVQIEHAIDAIACAFAPVFELPPPITELEATGKKLRRRRR